MPTADEPHEFHHHPEAGIAEDVEALLAEHLAEAHEAPPYARRFAERRGVPDLHGPDHPLRERFDRSARRAPDPYANRPNHMHVEFGRPRREGPVSPAELTRRLAAGLCTWCGGRLDKDSYHDLYCSPDHQMLWMQARNGQPTDNRPSQRIAPEDDPSIAADGPPVGLGLPQTSPDIDAVDSLGAWPGEPGPEVPPGDSLGERRHAGEHCHVEGRPHLGPCVDPTASTQTREQTLHVALGLQPSTDLPIGWDYRVATVATDGRFGATYEAVMPSDGLIPIVVGADQARECSYRQLAVGFSQCPGVPALAESKPPVLPGGPWPVRTMNSAVMRGYRSAYDTDVETCGPVCPLPSLRHCPRCEQWASPRVVTAQWPTIERCENTPRTRLRYSTQSKLCCSACLLPYPGPMLVPMVRVDEGPFGEHWTMSVVGEAHGERFVAQHSMYAQDVERMAAAPDAMARVIWRCVYDYAERLVLPWVCVLPGCDERVHGWLTAGATVGWQGWLWEPSDSIPLHMGLCGRHGCELMADAMRAPELSGRTGMVYQHGRWCVR